MNARILPRAVLGVVLVVTCAAPLIIWRVGENELRGQAKAFRVQSDRISTLREENARLSHLLIQPSPSTLLSKEEISKLLRLRAEVSALRQQTNSLGQQTQLVPVNPQTVRTEGGTNFDLTADAALSADTIVAMKNILAALPGALQRYIADHSGATPEDFVALRHYLLSPAGRPMTGMYTFEFVRFGGPKPGDDVILREQSPRQRGDLGFRVYGFADGHASEMSFPSDDEAKSLNAWERQHLAALSPTHAAPSH